MKRSEMMRESIRSEDEKKEFMNAMFAGEVPFWGNGGMGVDFSNHDLVAAVMEEGGFGTLSGSAPGYHSRSEEIQRETNFARRIQLYHDANEAEMKRQIDEVRDRVPHGVLAVNIMAAMSDFRRLVNVVGQSGKVDLLCVGAGLPRELAGIVAQYPHMRYAPIVSSDRAAKIMIRSAAGTGRPPDAFYVELPQYAGGHLGAKDPEDALDAEKFAADKLFREIRVVAPDTPLILAGGIAYRSNMDEALDMGYTGVAMGTRLLLTKESGMSDSILKDYYLDPNHKVVTGMTSPAGLPSRYLDSAPDDVAAGLVQENRRRCISCIGHEHCGFFNLKSPYCIGQHLSATRKGIEASVLFTGSCIEDIRHDSLYHRDGEKVIPTVEEAVEFVFEEKSVA